MYEVCPLPRSRFHSLRHISATLLNSHNVNLKTVSERLGHAKELRLR
ncbi:tyrosine-type recombinase/integrase [Peribacillus simplex]